MELTLFWAVEHAWLGELKRRFTLPRTDKQDETLNFCLVIDSDNGNIDKVYVKVEELEKMTQDAKYILRNTVIDDYIHTYFKHNS